MKIDLTIRRRRKYDWWKLRHGKPGKKSKPYNTIAKQITHFR
jgi:hypothetical protein